MSTPFFFILGRPRSGTTLLKTLFDAHPNVKIPPELPIFIPLYQKFKNVKTWDREHILAFVEHVFHPNVFNNRTLANLRIDRDQFTADLLQMENEGTIQDFLVKFNEHAWSLFPKKEILLVGDKNPVYSIFTKRFIKIFPEARFVCIVRDYRDNYVSLKNLGEVKLEAPVLTLQIARWRYITKLFLACREKFPRRFFVIRYEDLVTKPEESLGEICRFLNIPYVPDVFEYHRKKDELMKTFPNPLIGKIHKSLMNPVNTGRMELWKTQLSDREIRVADQIAGETAEVMGYERRMKRFSLAVYLQSLPMFLYTRLLFALMQAGSHMPYGASRWLSRKVLMLVGIYGRFSGKSSREVQNSREKTG
jgi:hypothetical protein